MMEQHLFKESEAARFLGVSTRTMQYWRTICKGPEYTKLNGTRIRYDRPALLRYIEQGRHSFSLRAAAAEEMNGPLQAEK
jgi:hypothetical protein